MYPIYCTCHKLHSLSGSHGGLGVLKTSKWALFLKTQVLRKIQSFCTLPRIVPVLFLSMKMYFYLDSLCFCVCRCGSVEEVLRCCPVPVSPISSAPTNPTRRILLPTCAEMLWEWLKCGWMSLKATSTWPGTFHKRWDLCQLHTDRNSAFIQHVL